MARILIIDDDDSFRTMLREMLERAGHEVVTAVNGKEGILRYKESPTDLVITDILMPEKEGIETILELQADFPAIKFITVSGGLRLKAENLLQIAACFPGVKKTLSKPFKKEEMLSAVDEVLKMPLPDVFLKKTAFLS